MYDSEILDKPTYPILLEARPNIAHGFVEKYRSIMGVVYSKLNPSQSSVVLTSSVEGLEGRSHSSE